MAEQDKSEDDEQGDEEAALAATVKAAKKKKLVLLGGLLVVLLLVAGGGTWFVLHMVSGKKEVAAEPVAEHKEEGAAKAEEKASPHKEPALYDALEPAFLANYLVGGKQHYLQLSVTVLAREQSAIDGMRTHMPLVRNRIVLLLSGETFEGLQTEEGRIQLQQKLLAAIQEILQKETGKPGIEQVFFTNFVMQ